MRIRNKKNASQVTEQFEEMFKFDTPGQKHYVFFNEKDTDHTLTIMKYAHGHFTVNRRIDSENTQSNSEGETPIEFNECVELIWTNRKMVNEILRLRGKA